MSNLPEGNGGKIAAIAILILAAATVYFAVLSPAIAFYDNSARTLEQRRELLRRYQRAVGDLPRLRAQQKHHRSDAGGAQLFLAGASDAIATAALQATLKEIVEDNDAEITNAAALPAGTAGSLRRVGVRIAFSGDLELVTAVLAEIQAARPILSVSNLDLHVTNLPASDSTGGDQAPDLGATLDVFAFRASSP